MNVRKTMPPGMDCHWKDSESRRNGEALHWIPSHISPSNRRERADV